MDDAPQPAPYLVCQQNLGITAPFTLLNHVMFCGGI